MTEPTPPYTDPPEVFMRRAIELAKEAAKLGEVPVAAVIVKDNKIIAEAHNRRELDKDPIAHAEVLAIKEAAKKIGDWRLEGCAMFVTLEPCPMCSGAMWLSRIEHCVFGASDHKSGFLGSVHDFTSHSQMNHHYTVERGILEEECVGLLQEFFRDVRARNKAAKKTLKKSLDDASKQ
jgi:tRNA(adenine34) deaminase